MADDAIAQLRTAFGECGESATAPEYLCAKHAQSEPLVTSDNEPPDPLPEVLPAGTHTRYGSVADGAVVLKEGSHYWGWWNKDKDRERCANADQIDWAHYRAQQAQAERPWSREAPPDSEVGQLHELLLAADPECPFDGTIAYDGMTPGVGSRRGVSLPTWGGWRMGGYGSVTAWRRAEQGERAQPQKPARDATIRRNARPVEPAADPIEALSKRVAAVERRVRELDQRTIGSAVEQHLIRLLNELALHESVICIPCAHQGVTRDATTYLLKGDHKTAACAECCKREVPNGNADGLLPVEQPYIVTRIREELRLLPLVSPKTRFRELDQEQSREPGANAR